MPDAELVGGVGGGRGGCTCAEGWGAGVGVG